MPSTQPPPLPPMPRTEPPRRYRALARLGRWPVGPAFRGASLPDQAPCTLLFPDVIGASVDPFVRAMAEEVGRNRLLADLPLVGVTHIGLDANQRPFAVFAGDPGVDLQAQVDAHGPLPPLAAVQVGVMLGDTLSRAHYRARVMGELLPWMVRLPSQRGAPLTVLDLGFARGVFDLAVQPPRPSPAFAAPRVRAGHGLRAEDDLYVIGALLYFALTGQPPTPSAPRPSDLAPLGPFAATLDAIVLQALGQLPSQPPLSGMLQLTRALRGVRDLMRLSPEAQAVALRVRGTASRAPAPGAPEPTPMAPGALGFIEVDGPAFLTQTDLSVLPVDSDVECLSMDALESLGDDALERIRTGKLPRLPR